MSNRAREALQDTIAAQGGDNEVLSLGPRQRQQVEAVLRILPAIVGGPISVGTSRGLIATLAQITDALLDSMTEAEKRSRLMQETVRDVEGLRRLLGTA